MKVIKPQRLALLQRVVEHQRRCTMVVSIITYAPIAEPRRYLMEMALWKDLGEVVAGGILDEGTPKPSGELLVSGSAYSASGEPVTGVMARVRVLRDDATLIDKKLAVVGNRYWVGGRPTAPVPFTTIPLDWTHAFGGEGFAANPHGKGAVLLETEQGPVRPLPNVEDPKQPMCSPNDTPLPAGFGPYEMQWPQRFDKVGKEYDDRWLKTLFPGPARDFDATFYNVAPKDQRLDDFFRGDELLVIEGMHPSKAAIQGQLAPVVVRAFVTQRVEGRNGEISERFVEISTRIDTVHVFPDRERVVVFHRGTLEVAEDDGDDIVHLMIAAEAPGQPKSIEHYQQVLALRLDKEKAALAFLKDDQLMPPQEDGWAVKADYGEMTELTRLEHRAWNKGERRRKRGVAQAKADLEGAGFDVADAFVEPNLPEIPDPFDTEALTKLSEEMNERLEKSKQELEAKKLEAQAQARKSFEESGWDYDAEMKKANVGGPIEFSADEHLIMLHDMARIAAEGGEPMPDLERDLTDPRYEQTLRALETRVRSAYLKFAHLMPPAAPVADEQRAMLRVRVASAKDAGQSMAKENLLGADLHELDLGGLDLSEALFEGADLSGANLSNCNLSNAVLVRADLTGTNLSGADLSGANLGSCMLKDTDLAGARLHGTVLMRSELDGASFIGADLKNIDFVETVFTSADFSHITADAPLFVKADLRGVAFIGAHLEQARFLEVDVRGVDFTGAVMPKVTFAMAQGDGACFAEAELAGAVFTLESSFADCCFAGAELPSANFRKTPLTRGNFEGATLHRADLSAADLRNANLHQIKAHGALMIRTRLEGADLRGADLLGVFMSKARLAGANLTGCNVSRGDLSLVRTDGATKVDEALMLDTRVDPQYQEPKT